MMNLFVVVLLAIIVANVVTGVAGFMLVMNHKFLTWYTKKIYKMTEEAFDEFK